MVKKLEDAVGHLGRCCSTYSSVGPVKQLGRGRSLPAAFLCAKVQPDYSSAWLGRGGWFTSYRDRVAVFSVGPSRRRGDKDAADKPVSHDLSLDSVWSASSSSQAEQQLGQPQ